MEYFKISDIPENVHINVRQDRLYANSIVDSVTSNGSEILFVLTSRVIQYTLQCILCTVSPLIIELRSSLPGDLTPH